MTDIIETATDDTLLSLRYTGAPTNYNFAVTKFSNYSAAGDCYSWYQGMNAHVSGGRENPDEPAYFTFFEMPFQETGRPAAGEWHLAMNGLDSTHIRAISVYSPIEGAVAGSFMYHRSESFRWHDWITDDLLMSRQPTGVWKYEAGEVIHGDTGDQPFLFQITANNILPLPYYNAAGRLELGQVTQTVVDHYVGRYLQVGTQGVTLAYMALGGPAATESRIEFRNGGTGTGTLQGAFHSFPGSVPLDLRCTYGFRISAGNGAPWATVNPSGLNLTNGLSYRINGTIVLSGLGAAIANASYAVASPTKAEFDALVDKLNTVLARMRAATPSIAT